LRSHVWTHMISVGIATASRVRAMRATDGSGLATVFSCDERRRARFSRLEADRRLWLPMGELVLEEDGRGSGPRDQRLLWQWHGTMAGVYQSESERC